MTNEEIEQVRQLRGEITQAERMLDLALIDDFVVGAGCEEWNDADDSAIRILAIEQCRICRTLARLEAELARLTAGMKPEATA